MKKVLITPLIASLTITLATSVQASTIMITQTAGAQLRDTDIDGSGNGLGTALYLITGYFAGQSVDLRTGWAFQMTGAAPSVTDADFTANVSSITGTIDFNMDLHVIRISSTSSFQNSDYETSSQLIMEDFWTSTDGTGAQSLDATAKTALATYLDNNWSENDYIFLGVQTDPVSPGSITTNDRHLFFNNANASLSVTVPEPSSSSLILLGGLALLRRHRK